MKIGMGVNPSRISTLGYTPAFTLNLSSLCDNKGRELVTRYRKSVEQLDRDTVNCLKRASRAFRRAISFAVRGGGGAVLDSHRLSVRESGNRQTAVSLSGAPLVVDAPLCVAAGGVLV